MATIFPVLRKYRTERAFPLLCTAGDEQRLSDIDLVVIDGAQLDPTDVFCIADELCRKLIKNMDIYELREINESTVFYHAIFSDGRGLREV